MIKMTRGEVRKARDNGELNFEETNLRAIDLGGISLVGVSFRRANLMEANLDDVDLRSANLADTDLRYAKLEGANLRGANLDGAKLEGARGVVSCCGAGEHRRMIYAYIYDGTCRFQIGCCFNGDYDEAVAAVTQKYIVPELEKYLEPYLAALKFMNLQLKAQMGEREND